MALTVKELENVSFVSLAIRFRLEHSYFFRAFRRYQ